MNRVLIAGGLSWCLACIPQMVNSVDSGLYGGARLGDFSFQYEPSQLYGGPTPASAGFDLNRRPGEPLKEKGLTLFGGYRLNQYLAIEAAWIESPEFGEDDSLHRGNARLYDTGEPSWRSQADRWALGAVGTIPIASIFETGRLYTTGALTAEAAPGGFALGAMGSVPIASAFGIFGKAQFSASEVGGSLLGTEALDKLGTGSLFGFGAQYDLSDSLSIKTEWERLNDETDLEIDFLSIGISARF